MSAKPERACAPSEGAITPALLATTLRGTREGSSGALSQLFGWYSAHVFGVAFRPGGFRPFLGASVSTITDRVVPAVEVFGPALPPALDVPAVEAFLLHHLPDDDSRVCQAAAAVELIAQDKAVTRVERLAGELGLSVRGLQRLFAEYVGIGPKWVIRRYRLHEVTARMADGGTIDWAALAADLGYADQGHFIRDFKTMFGEPPTWYAQRY